MQTFLKESSRFPRSIRQEESAASAVLGSPATTKCRRQGQTVCAGAASLMTLTAHLGRSVTRATAPHPSGRSRSIRRRIRAACKTTPIIFESCDVNGDGRGGRRTARASPASTASVQRIALRAAGLAQRSSFTVPSVQHGGEARCDGPSNANAAVCRVARGFWFAIFAHGPTRAIRGCQGSFSGLASRPGKWNGHPCTTTFHRAAGSANFIAGSISRREARVSNGPTGERGSLHG